MNLNRPYETRLNFLHMCKWLAIKEDNGEDALWVVSPNGEIRWTRELIADFIFNPYGYGLVERCSEILPLFK